ncbi:ATP-binding protein [Paludibacterium paludis]|uniref:ATP-binding protein n=2 Tax=Paludibacterium paludis TaxID=1225769 RepID=UPI001E505B3F|nr:ATP-binding protein [Paludibacterium paludis]
MESVTVADMAVMSPFSHDLPRAAAGLAQLRWLTLCSGALLCVAGGAAGVALPYPLLAQALLTLTAANLVLARCGARSRTPALWLGAGLAADVICLTEVLAFTGGAANPLASLYLPPVLFAALLLPAAFAWTLAFATLLAYAALFRWHLPWPAAAGDAAYAVSLHLTGMWVTFSLSALLMTGFVSWLARRLASREAMLTAAREALSRDEQLLAVGMQAAGAAHALSTPLNTLTLLVDEMAEFRAGDAELAADLQTMKEQLAGCRQALFALKDGAESGVREAPLFAMLADRLEGWRALRPDVVLIWTPPDVPDPVVGLDSAFWPAFFNLVNNAAEAGGGEVEVRASLAAGGLTLDVINRKGSLSDEQLARAGLTPLVSGKPAGMGLGVLLSHATLARLGGRLELVNRLGGGVHARIVLPLNRRRVP